jgi:hypothetical protein
MIKRLIKDIKEKKELLELDDKFVKEEINQFFKREPKILKRLENDLNPKSKEYKQTIKEVRAKLRRSYGLFRVEKESKNLKELIKTKDYQKILETHSSTKERLSLYPLLYKSILEMTTTPKTILDLGAGLNPLSYEYMKINCTYYAYDLSKEEVKVINQFFKEKKIKGEAAILDLLQIEKVKQLPKADIAFLFKMTDVLDKNKGHKTSEKIIYAIPAKFIVVSFPTLTISGKKMNYPRRGWIELMCGRLGYEFKSFLLANEIFYCIRKQVFCRV